MRDQNLQVIEVALTLRLISETLIHKREANKLTVVAPWAGEDFLEVWVTALLFSDHLELVLYKKR